MLYGSNSGTSEGFAQRVASDALAHGFRPSIGTLDKVALEVKAKLREVIMEWKGCTEEEAADDLERLSKASRFATDIFD